MEHNRYLIALGSNQRHNRYGSPPEILAAALDLIGKSGCTLEAVSPFVTSRPLGPSQRSYANSAAVVSCALTPLAMLGLLHGIEMLHGRERRGRPWRARSLDLDIVLWSGGIWVSPELQIPHPRFRERGFVLGPAAHIAGNWRDPVSGLSLHQLNARLTRNRPVPR